MSNTFHSGSLSALTLVLVTLLAPLGSAQSAPTPGFRLWSVLSSTDSNLMDTSNTTVQTWPSTFNPGVSSYLLEDGTLLRAINTITLPLITGGTGGGVQRVALDGTVLWDYRYDSGGNVSHHDIHPMPNGNVLLTAWETFTGAQAIAMGRDPGLISNNLFRPDHIIEVQPTGPTTGTIVWEWHVKDHLIQDFDPTKANFGVVANHPELIDINYPPFASESFDFNHINGLDYDPINDLIIMSTPFQDEVWIIDHSTTTAEAAGHTGGARGMGGDLLYRWGNPAAYRAGTAADQQLFFNHDPRFIPPGTPGAGNVTIFNNQAPGGSEVIEIDLPQDWQGDFIFGAGPAWGPAAPVWSHSGGFQSNFASSAQRLPNGHHLICSSFEGRLFEIDAVGNEVWSFDTNGIPFQTHHYDRTLWADQQTLSVSGGGTVNFDLITETSNAGNLHLLLGTTSGTTPGVPIGSLNLDLNLDLYTTYTVQNPNTVYLQNTYSVFNGLGRSTASLFIPPAFIDPAAVGGVVHHAFLTFGGAPLALEATSNPVPLTLVP